MLLLTACQAREPRWHLKGSARKGALNSNMNGRQGTQIAVKCLLTPGAAHTIVPCSYLDVVALRVDVLVCQFYQAFFCIRMLRPETLGFLIPAQVALAHSLPGS